MRALIAALALGLTATAFVPVALAHDEGRKIFDSGDWWDCLGPSGIPVHTHAGRFGYVSAYICTPPGGWFDHLIETVRYILTALISP
jgi:hypothetical protein